MAMEIVDRIGPLPPSEQAIWELDQRINERGVHVDVPLIETAISVGGEAKLELYAQIADAHRMERSPGRRRPNAMLKWLAEHGCKLSNMQKADSRRRAARAGARSRRPGSCWSCARAAEAPPP